MPIKQNLPQGIRSCHRFYKDCFVAGLLCVFSMLPLHSILAQEGSGPSSQTPLEGTMQPLVELVRPGPWAGVSRLIVYGSKLYLVNSQIFVNHNSADVYSYDLSQAGQDLGNLSFERRLFSQDAGTPMIYQGLLYWPFEDPRFSATFGEYLVTNGKQWQWHVVPEIRGFHVHGLFAHQKTLYALASGWKGRIYRSQDQGKTWEQWYEHPTPDQRVSRITEMTSLEDTVYFALTAWAESGTKLLFGKGDTVRPVPGWPKSGSVGALESFQQHVYAVNRIQNEASLWRTNGEDSAALVTALEGYRVYDMTTTSDTLWAVTSRKANTGRGGLLWKTLDGVQWEIHQQFPELPIALQSVASHIFVGTYQKEKGGALWGPKTPIALPLSQPMPDLPSQPMQRLEAETLQKKLAELDHVLLDVENEGYRFHLKDHLLPLAQTRDPEVGKALSDRLTHKLPQDPVPLFGSIQVDADRMARWYLLYAIAINGHGHIPQQVITQPWKSPPNRAEKYLEPLAAAAWAVTQLGQSDVRTLHALHTASQQPKLPPWAKWDIQAALHVLNGE